MFDKLFTIRPELRPFVLRYAHICVCAHKKHISTRQTHSHTQSHAVKWKTSWNIYTLTSGGSTNATAHNSSMPYVFRAEQREGRAAFALLLYLCCCVFGSVFTHSHCTAATSFLQRLNIIQVKMKKILKFSCVIYRSSLTWRETIDGALLYVSWACKQEVGKRQARLFYILSSNQLFTPKPLSAHKFCRSFGKASGTFCC